MTTVTVLATQVYAAGSYSIAPTSIPNAVTQLGIAVLRCTSTDTSIWPNATDTISYELDVSLDGGVTYQPWATGSDTGGMRQNKDGSPVTSMSIGGSLPSGTNRFIKGTVTLSAAIKTGATVTVQ